MTHAWAYDEATAPGVDYSQDDAVAAYERASIEIGNPAEEARQLLSDLGVQRDCTVIDIGCGSGVFVVEAAHRAGRVIGVDLSAPMLARARRRVEEAGLANVELALAGFLSYRHEGALADVVTTRAALHHLPDFWRQIALLKMNRMLKAGGKLCIADVVYSFAAVDYQAAYDGYIQRMKGLVRPEFLKNVELDLTREFMTSDWILEEMLLRAGFAVERQLKPDPFFALYVCGKTKAV
jgi:putative AdoMet-dependent methyltransferase